MYASWRWERATVSLVEKGVFGSGLWKHGVLLQATWRDRKNKHKKSVSHAVLSLVLLEFLQCSRNPPLLGTSWGHSYSDSENADWGDAVLRSKRQTTHWKAGQPTQLGGWDCLASTAEAAPCTGIPSVLAISRQLFMGKCQPATFTARIRKQRASRRCLQTERLSYGGFK